MAKLVVTVAQSAHAQIFEAGSLTDDLKLVEELAHPKSALHEGDLVTDGPGQSKERMGPQSRAMAPENTAKETEHNRFALEVAEKIREQRLSNNYDRAFLIAGPRFLGLIREHLGSADEKFLTAQLAKNIESENAQTVQTYVKEMMAGSN